MKTAISVDDELMDAADKAAQQMGVSRSRLFALALEDYLRQRRQQQTLDQLNRVYAGEPDPLTAQIKRKFRKTVRERW